MRNLKRVLSLALALIMMLGMMVIGASAASADFPDAEEINYTEAVDVISGLGVMIGDEKDNFNPTDILTREQAAKIMAYIMLGEKNAEKLGSNTQIFDDVAAGRWSAGYIAYCTNVGILAGYGNGNFGPEDKLTGVAFAKMLLTAAGYDAEAEGYVGNDWATNIAVDAIEAGIDIKGVILADELTREQAAQMVLQALEMDTVTYTKGTVIGLVGPYAVEIRNEGTANYAGSNRTDDGYGTQQFCEKYFPTLKKVDGVVSVDGTTVVLGTAKLADDYAFEIGRSGYVWATNKATLSEVQFTDTLLATVYDADYAGWTTPATAARPAARNFVAKANATADGGVHLYINGTQDSDSHLKKGAEVRLFDNDGDGDIDVVVALQETVKAVGTAGVKTTTGKDNKTYVTVAGIITTSTLASKVVGYEDLAADDVVLTVTMPTGITYLTLADSVTGQMTKRNIATGTIIFDGDEYSPSGLTGTDVDELFHSGNTNANTDYILWLDRGGYAVYDTKVIDPTLYAVVVDSDYVRSSSKVVTYYADLLFIDGTVEEDVVVTANAAAHEGEWVSYTINNKGEYVLTDANTAIAGDVEIDGKTAALGAGWRTTEKTIYLVQSGTPGKYTYAAYVGFEEVPALTAHGLNVVDSDKNTAAGKDIASHVYVASSDIYTTKDMLIYTLSKNDIDSYKDARNNTWYEVPVLVDGQDDILLMSAAQFTASFGAIDQNGIAANDLVGFYEKVLVDSATGQLKAAALTKADASYTSAVTDIDYAEKTIEMDGKVWNAGGADVYVVNTTRNTYAHYEFEDEEITVGDNIVYFTTSGKYVTEIYVVPANVKPVVISNNLASVKVKGVAATVTGGAGTEADPYTYVATVTSVEEANATLQTLEVVAKSTATVVTIYGGDGSVRGNSTNGVATDSNGTNNMQPDASAYAWKVTADGVYYTVSVAKTQTAQELIDAASAGDTVALPAGTYDSLVINDNLTIDGSAGAKITGQITLGAGVTNVTIKNCEIVVGNNGYLASQTVVGSGAVVTITGNTFTLADGASSVAAIYIDAMAGRKYVVTNNTFVGNFTEGAVDIDMTNGASSIEVTGNDFTGVTGAYIHVFNPDWSNLTEDVDDAKIANSTY